MLSQIIQFMGVLSIAGIFLSLLLSGFAVVVRKWDLMKKSLGFTASFLVLLFLFAFLAVWLK